jgi:hypothetical protein
VTGVFKIVSAGRVRRHLLGGLMPGLNGVISVLFGPRQILQLDHVHPPLAGLDLRDEGLRAAEGARGFGVREAVLAGLPEAALCGFDSIGRRLKPQSRWVPGIACCVYSGTLYGQ